MDAFISTEKARLGRGKNALVIDDNHIVRRNHKTVLEKLGFAIDDAVNGKQALQFLKTYGDDYYSIFVVDIIMPDMDGVEFISTIRQFHPDCKGKILVCSCITNLPVIKKIAAIGIDGYIMKPVDYHSFINKISALFPASGE